MKKVFFLIAIGSIVSMSFSSKIVSKSESGYELNKDFSQFNSESIKAEDAFELAPSYRKGDCFELNPDGTLSPGTSCNYSGSGCGYSMCVVR